MDLASIKVTLRANGLTPASSDEAIRSVLTRAGYSPVEALAAIEMVKGVPMPKEQDALAVHAHDAPPRRRLGRALLIALGLLIVTGAYFMLEPAPMHGIAL